MDTSIAHLIVQMVSPAVMVSACGLMLLTLGNRYGRVADRVRAFGAEYRGLKKLGAAAAPADAERMAVLEVHMPDVFRRGLLLRNAVMFFYIAIFMFASCSITIPLMIVWLPLVFFCFGMGSVMAGTVFALRETLLSYRLIQLDLPGGPPEGDD